MNIHTRVRAHNDELQFEFDSGINTNEIKIVTNELKKN